MNETLATNSKPLVPALTPEDLQQARRDRLALERGNRARLMRLQPLLPCGCHDSDHMDTNCQCAAA